MFHDSRTNIIFVIGIAILMKLTIACILLLIWRKVKKKKRF